MHRIEPKEFGVLPMRLSFRLKELLEERNKHGVIQEICRVTGIERHKISRILRNETRSVSLDTLEPLCDYCVNELGVDRALLPGLLFARGPMGFWEQLVQNPIQTYIGRRDGPDDDPENRMVNESDLHVHQVLVKETTRLGAPPHNLDFVASYVHGTNDMSPTHKQQLVRAQQDGQKFYSLFWKNPDHRALVSIGSVKSNPISAMILARSFGVDPFVAEDRVEEPGDRKCPIFLSYREEDSQVPSCAGGKRLALNTQVSPGIYYERSGNDWIFCPRTKTQDAAMVFYVYRHNTRTLELVLGGFSADATKKLGVYLEKPPEGPDDFLWPPVTVEDASYGLFVVKFSADSAPQVDRIPDETIKKKILQKEAEPA